MDSHKIAITQDLDSNTVNKDRADQLVIYICSKYSGDITTNSKDAKRYSRFAVEQGVIPIAPHLLFPVFMDELFTDISYCLVPSQHHMKSKGKLPATPRYHVMFPIETITNASLYAKTKVSLFNKYPFI